MNLADGRFTSASGRGSSKAVYVSTGDKFKTALLKYKEINRGRNKNLKKTKDYRQGVGFILKEINRLEKASRVFDDKWRKDFDDKNIEKANYFYDLNSGYSGEVLNVERFKSGGLKGIEIQNHREKNANESTFYTPKKH